MAKLSDVHQNPASSLDGLEALKRRYQRQNRELARLNATQAQQIQAFHAEIAQQATENLQLSAEIIRLQRQLDERDARPPVGVPEGTKQLLEHKLSELAELVRGLGGDSGNPTSSRRRLSSKKIPTAVKPDTTLRERPEFIPEAIPEDRAVGRSPRRSINVYDVEVSPIKPYIPLDSAMFDIRPRRRRDSANVESLVALLPKPEPQEPATPRSPNKRKYPEMVEAGTIEEVMAEPVAISPLISRVANVKLSTPEADEVQPVYSKALVKEFKESDTEVPVKHDARTAAPSPAKLDVPTVSRFMASNRQSLENLREQLAEEEVREAEAPAPVESRRALEPKSTNINVNLSPVKLPTVADFEYVKKDKPSPRERDPVKKGSRIAKPIIVQGGENTMEPEKTERGRRTRGVTVNYALPALNKKLRRDTEALVDAVTGIQPKRRSVSAADDTGIDNEKRGIRTGVDEIERRTSKMSIHHDAKTNADGSERLRARNSMPDRGLSERELEKMMSEKVRDRETRLREARKDIYEFTKTTSPDAVEMARRTAADRNSLNVTATTGSHQRRTSGGLAASSNGISAVSTSKRDSGETKTSSSALASNLKSASDIIEERRRRRATLGATATGTGSSTAKKTVEFAASVTERERTREGRRRSMVV